MMFITTFKVCETYQICLRRLKSFTLKFMIKLYNYQLHEPNRMAGENVLHKKQNRRMAKQQLESNTEFIASLAREEYSIQDRK